MVEVCLEASVCIVDLVGLPVLLLFLHQVDGRTYLHFLIGMQHSLLCSICVGHCIRRRCGHLSF
jgi:hypothetical protein